MWRDFPQKLCDVLQCNGVVYDRTAYGKSSPWPTDPGLAYMEIEADVVLPRLLAALAIDDCVLVGHSDGGTIALNYAANDPEPLRAVVTLAAHAINEPVCVAAIHRAREAYATGDLRQRLAKYHGDNVDRAFHLWSDAWVAPGFEPMDANGRLPRIEVPVQAIQGEDDDYGSELQLGIIAGKVGGYCETRLIARLRPQPPPAAAGLRAGRDRPVRRAAGAGGMSVAHSTALSLPRAARGGATDLRWRHTLNLCSPDQRCIGGSAPCLIWP